MKKIVRPVFLFSLLVIIGCAGSSRVLKFIEEPKEGNVVIIGNVIIENINQEFAFDNWEYGSEVVIVSKTPDGTINHYTVNADAEGYYCLPNVPAGPYAVKAVILPVIGAKPLKLVCDLTSPKLEFYRMRFSERPIEYTAEWLPTKEDGRIINLGIMWFGLRTAEVSDLSTKSIGRIATNKFSEDLKNKQFYDYGVSYNRENALTYFKKKFPDSGWWEL